MSFMCLSDTITVFKTKDIDCQAVSDNQVYLIINVNKDLSVEPFLLLLMIYLSLFFILCAFYVHTLYVCLFEGIQSSGTGVAHSWELPCRC